MSDHAGPTQIGSFPAQSADFRSLPDQRQSITRAHYTLRRVHTGMVYDHHILNDAAKVHVECGEVMEGSLWVPSDRAEDEDFSHTQAEHHLRMHTRVDASDWMYRVRSVTL
jgi:hypothetical protein